MNKNIDHEVGSDNVFVDIGFSDADERLAKAEIAFQICQIIRARRLKQDEAAEILGCHQPDVSNLMNGHLDRFSEGRLFQFLNKLDKNVRMTKRVLQPVVVRGR